MSGWSRSGGGACFWFFLFCFVLVAKRPIAKLARFGGCFTCFFVFLRGVGRVSPPKNGKECQSGG